MALTHRYVSSTGTATYAASTDPATMCSLGTAMAGATIGDCFHIKADGVYTRGATDTLAGNGSIFAPIMWIGYNAITFDSLRPRAAGGSLDVSNFPNINYNSTFRLNVSGRYHIWAGINIGGSANASLVTLGIEGAIYKCAVNNTSPASGAIAIDSSTSAGVRILDCDASIYRFGGSRAIRSQGGAGSVVAFCRCTAPGTGASGLEFRLAGTVYGNVIYNCGSGGIAVTATTATPVILNNTIYGITGDGIVFLPLTTNPPTIINNHITDCSGWGVNIAGSSCAAIIMNNRFRDCAGGTVNYTSDWLTSVFNSILTDTGTAATDYTNVDIGDFSLIRGSCGAFSGLGYLWHMGGVGLTSGMTMAPVSFGSFG